MSTKIRSLAKMVTWRVIATSTTFILSFIFTGHVSVALNIAGFEVVAKMLFFYLHERGWNLIQWGRECT